MKANEETPAGGSSGYCAYGAGTILGFAEVLQKHAQGTVLGSDPEDVHQMRVFSRRTRTALTLFSSCFPANKLRTWNKEIARVAKSLGEARDTDVQITYLDAYLKKSAGRRNLAVSLLLSGLADKRNAIQQEVKESLQELEDSGLLSDIGEECKKALDADTGREKTENASCSRLTYLAAHIHINARIDDLLALEECVYMENDAKRHHQMRIAAKKLRYTLEIFKDLYKAGLQEEIEEMKNLQDILGEMHDCDLWIERLPQLMAQARQRTLMEDSAQVPAPGYPGIVYFARRLIRSLQRERRVMRTEGESMKFLSDLHQRRKKLYRKYVSSWDDRKERKVFLRLSEKTGDYVSSAGTGPLKIALISDVHGNIHALRAVEEDARKRGADAFLNAGDLVGHGTYSQEAIKELRSGQVFSIAGNYDLKVVKERKEGRKKNNDCSGKEKDIEYTCSSLTKSSIRFIQSLPEHMRLNIGGKRILVVHGSPKSADEYIKPDTPDERLREIAKTSGADVIISGHAHIQFMKTVDNATFIAPGSVGNPYDKDSRAAYAILTLDPFTPELLRIPYDIEAATYKIRKKRLPEKLAQSLLLGSSPEEIQERGEEKKEEPITLLEKIEKASIKYKRDHRHEEQVKTLSLKLFDVLAQFHGLGPEDRLFLQCAALLHDIGWSRGGKGHHKTTLSMILNDQDLPLGQKERYIIGSIARYHKGRLPRKKDYNLAPLKEEEKDKTIMLASIMRLADGMDSSHGSIVKDVKASVEDNAIKIECTFQGDKRMEEETIAEKKDLLSKITGKEIIIHWRQKT
jgi:putative phosphoesterase